MGIITGYPIGAKIVSDFKSKNLCSQVECERLLSFTNNSGPLFIIGTVGIGLFRNLRIGYILFLSHLLASLSVGFLFRWWKCKDNKFTKNKNSTNYSVFSNNQVTLKFSKLGAILANSITSAIHSIVLIGGFVVIFSVIISILNSSYILTICTKILTPITNLFNIPNEFITGIITGIIEVTNGVSSVSVISNTSTVSILICAFLLGFGGISVLLQVLAITSKAKISIKPYLIGKLAQACLSVIYTALLI